MKKFKLLASVLLLFLLVIIAFPAYNLYQIYYVPMLNSAPDKAQVITVEKNSTAKQFTQLLKANHLISNAQIFWYWMRYQGLTNQLKAGIYDLRAGETANDLLHRVIQGKVMVLSFKIIEGTTLNQVIANLDKAPYLTNTRVDWTGIQNSYPNAEGLLLADTYYYNAGTDARFITQLAHQNLHHYLSQAWKTRDIGLPYGSPYDMLIAASILEKETSRANERKLIAGVIANRLDRRMPLQMDPTVIYALGANFQGKLSHENMSVDSPYNTYRYRGLPPTPIAMVGKEAIDAAAHPEPSDYLYFVAKGDGSHVFSKTYEEQRQAIFEYQKKG